MTSPAPAWIPKVSDPGQTVIVRRFLIFRRPAITAGKAFDFYGQTMIHLIGYRRPVPLARITPTMEGAPCNTP